MSDLNFEKDLSRHPLHYFVLLCVELIGLWGVFWYSYLPKAQLIIVAFMALSYVVWGVFHHYEHKDLRFKIIWEYLIIALLGVLLFSAIIFRT